jgi:phosphate-selective porin OprO/OprP
MIRRLVALCLLSIPMLAAAQRAAEPPSVSAMAAELATLKQRLLVLERQLELQREETAGKAAGAPVLALGDKGMSAKSADGNVEIKLRGAVQADQRSFLGDDSPVLPDTFLFRLVRPTIEGQFGQLVGFRLTPEFAGDSASLVDAWIDLRFDPAYTLRVGKFTSPVGLERLQSSTTLAMMERALPSELAPNRDIGVQLQGELSKGEVSYALGAFNGAVDGRDVTSTDVDSDIELAGRVFFEPWKNDASAVSGLGFGLGASSGDKHGAGNSFLPRYRTPGQNVFFNYRAAVLADGAHRRFSPQAYFYRNRLGLMGEWISSEQDVVLGANAATRATLRNTAWQLTANWVLTGEDAGYRGIARPSHPFTANGEGWGAFDLVTRLGELAVDEDAFPAYADPSVSARRSRAWGVGLNWIMTSNLKLAFNLSHASFDGGAALGADREDEDAFFSRVQFTF